MFIRRSYNNAILHCSNKKTSSLKKFRYDFLIILVFVLLLRIRIVAEKSRIRIRNIGINLA